MRSATMAGGALVVAGIVTARGGAEHRAATRPRDPAEQALT
ncbi:hypothetical protein [Nocardia suismassiliense]|nr:hypothetical protein [Nocardia suismassiliense]